MPSSRRCKRQCDSPSDHDAKRHRFEDNEDVKTGSREIDAVLGHQDYFSTLPADCLFAILTLLDRGSLVAMQGVNRKMHYITRHKGYRKPKGEEVKDLTISQDCYGLHEVMMHKFSEKVFAYRESRTVIDGVKGKARNKEDLLKDPSYYLDDDYANCEYTVRNVPERVFQAVDVLLFKYEPRNLYLREIILDKPFIERLATAVNHRYPERIHLNDVRIGEGVRLDQFIYGTQSCRLSISRSTHFEQAEFAADFFREFGRLCQIRQKSAELDVWCYTGSQISHFTPTLETLPYFLVYSTLVLKTLSLTAELLIELIRVTFPNHEKSRFHRWLVSLDEHLTKAQFHQLEAANFIVTGSQFFGASFTIEKRDSQQKFNIHQGHLMAGFHTIEISVYYCKDNRR